MPVTLLWMGACPRTWPPSHLLRLHCRPLHTQRYQQGLHIVNFAIVLLKQCTAVLLGRMAQPQIAWAARARGPDISPFTGSTARKTDSLGTSARHKLFQIHCGWSAWASHCIDCSSSAMQLCNEHSFAAAAAAFPACLRSVANPGTLHPSLDIPQ